MIIYQHQQVQAAETLHQIETYGVRGSMLPLDLDAIASLETFAAAARAQLQLWDASHFHQLVNSAGLHATSALGEIGGDDIHLLYRVHFKASLLLTQLLTPQLRAEAGRRTHLFEPVDAAGCPPAPVADLAPPEEVRVRLVHLATNMLLSLLAAIDHEVTARVSTEQWAGCSLLGALLAPDDMRGVCSPIALMVDLVLAAGVAASDGEFPAKRPKVLDVERRLAGRKRVTGTTARVINSMRRREKKLDRRALRTLMLDTKLRSAGPGQTVAKEADMLIPLLAAAHMLTALMPTPRNKKAHPIRRGWRAAYLCWWRRQAEARGLPTVPTGDPGPPAWVTFA